jgi:hypothetical protein
MFQNIMSEPNAKLNLTRKRKMTTFYEIQKEIETIVKAETPNRLDLAYAKLWGIAVAHLTEEQMLSILKNRKAR